jgi:hypothetical protein
MKIKSYESPEMTFITNEGMDIITASSGIESPIRTDGDVIWDLDLTY